jgi:hypothetical protein
MTPQMTLLSAPIEQAGDWGASSPEDALIVLSRTREVCLAGVSSLSDDQPSVLRVESRSSGPPHLISAAARFCVGAVDPALRRDIK